MANTLRFKRGLASGIPTAAAGEPLFTTDTFDLYIGNGTTNTRFQKYIASGATTQILRGDGSLYTFPLAISSPTNGQVLKYNGTSWVNDSDAGITGSLTTNYLPKATGATTLGNSLVYDNGTNVGIGTASPGQKLSVQGEIAKYTATGYDLTFDNVIKYGYFGNLNSGTTDANRWIGIDATITAGAAKDNILRIRAYAGGTSNTLPSNVADFRGDQSSLFYGNVLINTGGTDSGEKLQVTGTMKVTGVSTFGSTISVSGAGNPSVGRIEFGTSAFKGILDYSAVTGLWYFNNQTAGGATTNYYQFQADGTAIMTLTKGGNLGLGVTPSAWASTRAIQVGLSGSIANRSGGNGFYMSSNLYFSADPSNTAANGVYINSDFATTYLQANGAHRWYNAPSGTAGNPITFTQAMTLDASGNLMVGPTSTTAKIDVQNTGQYIANLSSSNASGGYITLGRNGALNILGNYSSATGGGTAINADALFLRSSNGIGFGSAGANTSMWLTTTSNLVVGSTTDSGEKLQVNGTAKITGATTVGGNLTVGDTTTGRNVNIYASSYGSNGLFQAFGTDGLLKLQMGGLGTNTAFLYTGAGNAMQFFSGNAVALTLASNQAATFTGNLTVDTNTLFVDATDNEVGIGTTNPLYTFHTISANSTIGAFRNSGAALGQLLVGNTAGDMIIRILSTGDSLISSDTSKYLAFGSNGATERMRITSGGDVGIGMTPSYKLDVTGSARVSDAIAIGTTPDTNNPFKILKNINATVGIKFENTNTSSSAFSAVQLGTDVSGGTKFTNLVYASSGISASGVYNPDGTSLINNGNGGLNFLGNPIRMYTGGSNGVLRWDLVNDGYITHYSATAPTTSATDGYRQYSADVTAGNAAPHFRTENGAVIKLYQETTAVGNSIISLGGGNSVLDDTTFDGYTLRQIVKALRNQGILA